MANSPLATPGRAHGTKHGRLDVYSPDGPFESHSLEKPTIAIGRSPGNDVVLDYTSVSRYHVTFSHREDGLYLEDLGSANGTYIDGKRLTANDPQLLRGGEEIQIGDLRTVYVSNDDQSTRELSATTASQVSADLNSFTVQVVAPLMPVTPGAHVQGTLTITNNKDEIRRFTVQSEGLPPTWLRFDRSEVEIDPGSSVQIVYTIKPVRRPDSVPGTYPVILRVTAADESGKPAETEIMVNVREYAGFGMALTTDTISGDQPFTLHIHNQGSSPLPLTLGAEMPGGGVRFQLRPQSLVLAPNEKAVVQGSAVRGSGRLLGTARQRKFFVIAKSGEASGFLASMEGTYQERAMLPAWAAWIGVGTVVFGIMALIAMVIFLARPRPAEVVSFQVLPLPNSYIRGVIQEFRVRWDVQNAARVGLTTEGALFDSVLPSVLDAQGDTTLRGVGAAPIRFVLNVVGNDGTQTSQTVTLEPQAPICNTARQPLSVHSGPGDQYPLLSSLDVPQVEVERRNPGADWIRIGGQSFGSNVWTRAADLQCPFLLTALIQVGQSDIPPTPIPVTATPIPPTPPPTAIPVTLTPLVTIVTATPIASPTASILAPTATQGGEVITVSASAEPSNLLGAITPTATFIFAPVFITAIP